MERGSKYKDKQNKKQESIEIKQQEKCSSCGFLIRGKNHDQGEHHKIRKNK